MKRKNEEMKVNFIYTPEKRLFFEQVLSTKRKNPLIK
jgi:hypothetical protein